jgi:hypothetical protein
MPSMIVRYNVGVPISEDEVKWVTVIIRSDIDDPESVRVAIAREDAEAAVEESGYKYGVTKQHLDETEVIQVGGIIYEPD